VHRPDSGLGPPHGPGCCSPPPPRDQRHPAPGLQVDAMLQEVAEEHNLELDLEMPNTGGLGRVAEKPQDELQARLAALKEA